VTGGVRVTLPSGARASQPLTFFGGLRYNAVYNQPEAFMLEQIEAVYENGVFRPLGPVPLPERQRVTLLVPTEDDAFEEEVDYQPLPLRQVRTIRVRVKRVGDLSPIPYPVEADELEQE
jgi:predicted DNA-binding antitoxin AbrB/MazE fold protein